MAIPLHPKKRTPPMKTFALLAFAALSLSAQTKDTTKKPKPASSKQPTMGAALDEHTKACVPGDNSPAGTVLNGYTKVIEATPFGNACRWVAAQQ